MTLGLRNNNPLNIRKVPGTTWKGEIPQSSSPLGGGREGSAFVQFSSMEWGIRAAFVILQTYRRKYNATCIEAIISRWAPSSENSTAKYIEGVCRLTGFGGKERLSERDWPSLIRAMAMIECGAQLWLRLERTRRLLEVQHKRFCIRNVLKSWFGLRASDDFIWEICMRCAQEGWSNLPPPMLYPRKHRELLRAIVSVTLDIGMRKVNLKALDTAYSIAFPKSTSINVNKKKR